MQVEYLYVISVFGGVDSLGRELENKASSLSLFNKYKKKCGAALLVHLDLRKQVGCELQKTTSLDMPVAEGLKMALSKCSVELVPGAEGKKYRTKIGVYLVFHSEEDAVSIWPKETTEALTNLVRPDRLGDIQKVSLVSCNVARQTTAKQSDLSYADKSFEEVMKTPRALASPSTMFALMQDFRKAGINPAICGYDIPIFLGRGPLGQDGEPLKHGPNAGAQAGKIMHPIQQWNGNKWVPSPDGIGDGRKLTIPGKVTLNGISDLTAENNQYRNLHKRVLRIDKDGKICFGLSGWSDKPDN